MNIQKTLPTKYRVSFLLVLVGGLFLSPQAVAANPVELSFAMHLPPKAAPYAGAYRPWAAEIEKRTKGQLKFKFYLAQSLLKTRNAYQGVINGIADAGWGANSWTPGRFPLISVMELPFLSPDTFVGARALNDLYKKFPEIRAEHKDLHILHLWVSLPYEVHTIKKPVRKLEDMRGLKLATQAGAKIALELMGAVPITVATPKIYPTVEKGVADGTSLAWGAYKAFKIYEVTNYHTNAHLGGIAFWTAINKNAWNKLPKNIQQAVTEVTSEMMPDTLSAAVTKEKQQGIQISKKRNQEIIELSPEERARWIAASRPSWDKWVKDREAEGLPGRVVLEEALRLVKKYQK